MPTPQWVSTRRLSLTTNAACASMTARRESSTSWDWPTTATAMSRVRLRRCGEPSSLDDRMPQAHYLLGLCLRDRRPRDQAERALLRAVELEPTFAAAREELVTLYTDSGRHRQAIEQLEALSALEPTRPERLVSVGLAYARLGRRDAAVLTLGRAVERHPDSTVVYTALGRVWLEAAEGERDRVALSKAHRSAGTGCRATERDERCADDVRRALFLSGSTTAAERVLRRATEQFPVEPVAFTYLASAARRLGHVDDGSGSGSQARGARRRVKSLTGTLQGWAPSVGLPSLSRKLSPKQIHPQHHERNRESWKHGEMRRVEHVRATVVEHRSPAWCRRLHAETQGNSARPRRESLRPCRASPER